MVYKIVKKNVKTSFRVSGSNFEPSHKMTFLQVYDKVLSTQLQRLA